MAHRVLSKSQPSSCLSFVSRVSGVESLWQVELPCSEVVQVVESRSL